MATEKVVPQKLSREAYHALESVVGKEWVSEDRAIIESYVIHCIDAGVQIAVLSKNHRVRAAAVILPATTEEVQSVTKVANRYGLHIVPFANAQIDSSPTAPNTVLVSMRRMKKIQVDETNMLMTIEPFVDYGMIHHEASKRGLWLGGSGWHGAISKPCSQSCIAGVWQSDLKYNGLSRSIIGAKIVLPDGSLLRLGSAAIAGTGEIPFTENIPGPNLWGIFKASLGSRGIVTELTLKLHPWVGGHPFPEDRGRPSIEHYFEETKEKKFDRPPTHPRHKIFWFEYPTLESITEGSAKLAGSGIGIALNITGNYNSMMCSYTIAEANKRSRAFFGITGYMVLAGISSEKQLAYEEKVLKHIVEETGGKLLSPEYKPELLDALSPWNVEYVLNTETGMRTVRSNYMSLTLPPFAGFSEIKDSAEIWKTAEKDVGFVGEDRGEYFSRMMIDCPYAYITDRGHQLTIEMDQFPERSSLAECTTFLKGALHAYVAYMNKGYPGSWMMDTGEPFLSNFPEIGPDTYLLTRGYRRMTDPKGIYAPGRVILSSEEFKATAKKMPRTMQTIHELRAHFGLPKLELTEEGDRWKPTE